MPFITKKVGDTHFQIKICTLQRHDYSISGEVRTTTNVVKNVVKDVVRFEVR
jgi:hypothetical protein